MNIRRHCQKKQQDGLAIRRNGLNSIDVVGGIVIASEPLKFHRCRRRHRHRCRCPHCPRRRTRCRRPDRRRRNPRFRWSSPIRGIRRRTWGFAPHQLIKKISRSNYGRNRTEQYMWRFRILANSVADPRDPYDFGPPGSGSGSTSTRYGSGSVSFSNQAKIVKKNFIPSVVASLWLFIFEKECKCTM